MGADGNSSIFASAHAEFDATSGVLTATGESGVEALNLGGVVRIGNVSSSVHVVDDGQQEPQIEYSTDIGAVTVLGIPIGIDEDGVSVLGNSIPLLDPVEGVVNDALQSLGVTLHVVPAEIVLDEETGRVESVTTGALQIRLAVEVPAIGLTEVRLTIGRVFLQFLNRPFPERSAPAPGSTAPAPSSATGSPTTPAPEARPPAASSALPSGGNVVAPGPASAPVSDAGPIRVASGLPDSTSFRGIYLILVLAGIAMAGPAALLERAGLVARRIWR